ncbi:MAG: hypothetical protein ABID09_08420 [Candidatus Omnitrophota bacterium]
MPGKALKRNRISPLKPVTGFTLTELIFVVVTITVFILLLTPFISNIRIRAKAIGCEENLQKIGLGLKVFANEHQGQFPSTLSELIAGNYVEDERVFDCPNSPHAGSMEDPDYHFTTGYSVLSPSDTWLVFDKDDNHSGGGHVLYVSGDIKWIGDAWTEKTNTEKES